MENNTKKVKVETIVRTLLLVVALINQLLLATGHTVLPVSDDQLEQLIVTFCTIVTALWGWWKNNSFTQAAIAADEVMAKLKGKEG